MKFRRVTRVLADETPEAAGPLLQRLRSQAGFLAGRILPPDQESPCPRVEAFFQPEDVWLAVDGVYIYPSVVPGGFIEKLQARG